MEENVQQLVPEQRPLITVTNGPEMRKAIDAVHEMILAGDITSVIDVRFFGRTYHLTPPAMMDELYRVQLARISAALEKTLIEVAAQGGKLTDRQNADIDEFATEIRLAREQLGHVGGLTRETYRQQLQGIDLLVDRLITAVPVGRVDEPGADKSPALSPKLGHDPDGVRIPPLKDLLPALGMPLHKAVEQMMEEKYPALMAKFYPRIYEATGRYHSPKACAAMLANVVAETLRTGFGRAPTAHRLMMPALELMARRRMPMFFIAPDLLEAVQRTDFTEDINWTEMTLPYDQGLFVLPKGSFVHPEDGDVSMILWARFQPGDYMPPALGIPTLTLPDTSMVIVCLCPKTAIWYDSTLNGRVRPLLRLNNLFYRAPGEEIPRSKRNVPYLDADLNEQDEEFIEKLGVIAFGTFMVMDARPELVEPGKLLRRVGKADKVREFWSPNVIGPRYKLKREVPRIVEGKFVKAPAREGGTHASPRMHWRRGHHRNQPVGTGRKERKRIWIEPCLIGAE